MNVMPAEPKASEFDYKSAARKILPRLAATAAKSDRARRLDDDAAAALRESGLSRILTPKRFGGYETSPSGHIWACAELGKVCSSASWVLMVCVAHDYIVGRFPDECQSEVYEGDADNLLAGCLQPQGTLERTPGGWRLSGRWQFGSGCDHSPWFIFGAKVSNPGPNEPLVRHIMIPRAEVEFDDTWHTLGMRGSGSKDLVVKNAFIPDHRTVATYPAFIGLSPHAKSPTYRLPVYAGLSSMMTASVLGMAERGFNAFVEKTRGRKSAYGVSKADSSGMQRRIAESGAELAQARRLLDDICSRFDAAMIADKAPMPDVERIQFRWDAAYIAELCRRSMERIYASAGAHCLYEGDPILVAYRDVVTACHHAVVDFDTVSELYGRVTLKGSLNENPLAAPFA